MKTFYIASLLLLLSAASKAQLKGTKWEGKMNVPDETKVLLDFKKDSVDIIVADNEMVAETMTYSVQDTLITLKKTSGMSPCTAGDVFKVKYLIRDDKLFITTFSDACDVRVVAWTKEPFIRVKE